MVFESVTGRLRCDAPRSLDNYFITDLQSGIYPLSESGELAETGLGSVRCDKSAS